MFTLKFGDIASFYGGLEAIQRRGRKVDCQKEEGRSQPRAIFEAWLHLDTETTPYPGFSSVFCFFGLVRASFGVVFLPQSGRRLVAIQEQYRFLIRSAFFSSARDVAWLPWIRAGWPVLRLCRSRSVGGLVVTPVGAVAQKDGYKNRAPTPDSTGI